jgi:hypothetical protein
MAWATPATLTVLLVLVILWENRELLLVSGGICIFYVVFKGNMQARQASWARKRLRFYYKK